MPIIGQALDFMLLDPVSLPHYNPSRFCSLSAYRKTKMLRRVSPYASQNWDSNPGLSSSKACALSSLAQGHMASVGTAGEQQ